VKHSAILYAAFIMAALLLGVGIPLLVHSSGASEIARWQGLVNPGPLSRAHEAFGDQCLTCHTPHERVDTQKCVACHANTDFGSKQSTLFHANAKQCTSCHVEHLGGQSPIKMNHDALLVEHFWKVPQHRATLTARKRPASGDPLKALDCASCHSNRDPHQGLFGRTCSSCHGLESWKIAGFRHPSVNSAQCSQCHKAPPSHYMMHFEMVSQRAAGKRARVEQCSACHSTDSWNNIRGVGPYDHH
jgi:hypothetical protein